MIWSGGCTHDGALSDWSVYCLDGADFNTASAYFTVNPESITFLKAGFYRITYRSMALGPIAGSAALFRNNSQFHLVGINEPGNNPWQWRDVGMDVTWPFNGGDQLVIKAWNPGLYSYIAWTASGKHSRVQVQYVGPLQ